MLAHAGQAPGVAKVACAVLPRPKCPYPLLQCERRETNVHDVLASMRVPLNDLRRSNEPYAAGFRAAFERLLAKGLFILGDEVSAFEAEFAAYCGVAHCVGVANGSDALELALRAIGVRSGDDVATV